MNTSREKVIEHLSNEITTHTAYLTTFRSRMAFGVLVGPFIVLGSFLVGTHGNLAGLNLSGTSQMVIFALLAVAAAMYVWMAIYGAMLDRHAIRECNRWRELIVRLSQSGEGKLEINELNCRVDKAYHAYLCGIIPVLVAFAATTFVTFLLLTSPRDGVGTGGAVTPPTVETSADAGSPQRAIRPAETTDARNPLRKRASDEKTQAVGLGLVR